MWDPWLGNKVRQRCVPSILFIMRWCHVCVDFAPETTGKHPTTDITSSIDAWQTYTWLFCHFPVAHTSRTAWIQLQVVILFSKSSHYWKKETWSFSWLLFHSQILSVSRRLLWKWVLLESGMVLLSFIVLLKQSSCTTTCLCEVSIPLTINTRKLA